ncbi:septation protein SepH [Corynebacterium glyciniphilum]|uniref:septation protein SepH n=1 Tax=Corynebacterium glyciniphilum TaxID=1404244 RepID=UPI003FD562E2
MAENTQWMEVPPMQELRFVKDDSDRASLVLRMTTDEGTGDTPRDASGDVTESAGVAEFFLPVTDELTEFLGIPTAVPETTETEDAAGTTDPGAPDTPREPAARVVAPLSSGTPEPVAVPTRERVHLRPKEIQDRIRHGETVEQIVADTGMEDRRVRPFAVPIAMERNRIADMARDAHPVRADGPTDSPLREVLAGAFAARGESLRASEWSAAMDSSDHWVISVSWTKGNREGGSRFVADFRYVPGEDGPATAEPVNSVASDLIDPRFERPVRTVSPVVPTSRQDDVEDEDPDDPAGESGVPSRDNDATRPDNRPVDAASDPTADAPVDLFGRRTHPAGGDNDSAKRKKKAVTPHWEDVLLGVRTNPKANGRNKKK